MTMVQGVKAYWRKLYAMWRMRSRRCALCYAVYTPPPEIDRHSPLPLESPHENIASLCPACQLEVQQKTSGFCPSCGAMYTLESAPCIPCIQCLTSPPPWKKLLFYGVYAPPLSYLIQEAKFELNSVAIGVSGELLCIASQPIWHEYFDAIIPVPLHISRLRERGGNQCIEIARPLSRFLDVPIRSDLLHRIRKTPHQLGLTAKERMRNLDNAFKADPACQGLHVLLVDDVMTTGTTLRRCAEALNEAGVASVTVLAVARTKGL